MIYEWRLRWRETFSKCDHWSNRSKWHKLVSPSGESPWRQTSSPLRTHVRLSLWHKSIAFTPRRLSPGWAETIYYTPLSKRPQESICPERDLQLSNTFKHRYFCIAANIFNRAWRSAIKDQSSRGDVRLFQLARMRKRPKRRMGYQKQMLTQQIVRKEVELSDEKNSR